MKNRKYLKLLLLCAFALVSTELCTTLPAQDNTIPSPGPVTSDVSIIRPRRVIFLSPWQYDIADGVVFELKDAVLAAGNGAVFEVNLPDPANVFAFRPDPNAVDKSGRFIFSGNSSPAYSGVAHISRGIFVLENGSVINNSAATIGGAFTIGSQATIRTYNVLFQGNNAPTGAVISFRTNLGSRPRQIFQSSTFIGNYSTYTTNDNGGGGVFGFDTGSADVLVADTAFINNRGGHSGGAVMFRLNTADLMFQDVTIIDGNWAPQGGGAIYDRNGIGLANKSIVIQLTGTLAGRHIVYENNAAGNVAVPVSELVSGIYSFTPQAHRGGFYFSQNTGALLFNIASDVTLSIGRAGNNPALDSLATADSAAGYNSVIDKVGGGLLILNANNAHFQGTTNVQAGTLLLGNPDAKLGGVINIYSGATFGGSGTLTTRRANGTISASPNQTRVSGSANAFLQVGTETAADAETLHILGNLSMQDGFTITHDLFASGSASLLQVNDLSLAGNGTINLGLLATGTFVLAQWQTGGVNANQLTLTIDGVTSNPRSSGSLIVDDLNKQLLVSNTVNNLQMKWTGAGGSTWLRRPTDEERNWADMSASGENRFFTGDSVIFDGVSDAANAANRIITIETGGVATSGMEVNGNERYEFRGDGITASADAVGTAQFAATGKLVKSGDGELVFANNAANTFEGGIDISGGKITFGSALQLGTGTGAITFADSGTLHAGSSVNTGGAITGAMNIAAGKTADLIVDRGGSLIYSGALTSGAADSTFRKTGAGTLTLTGDSSANTGNVSLDAGVITLGDAGASLGGKITVASGVIFGGIGSAGLNGSVKIASGGMIDVGVSPVQPGTLTVNNLEMSGGGILRVGLFSAAAEAGYNQSDRLLDAGTSAISGANIIDLESFASGTFNLGNVTGLAANSSVTISGMTIPTGGRLSTALSGNGGILQLVASSDKSRLMTWTGAGGDVWNLTQANWAGSDNMTAYSYGDHVVFDGAVDSAHAANRSIFINATEVRISDMTVSGDADYTFTGGGINADATNVLSNDLGQIDLTAATGKLVKTGNGTLSFDNGANTFAGGVEIAGGVIAINDGNQLSTGGAGITFTGDAAIRTTAGNVTINGTIAIASGKTGAFDVAGDAMTLQGTVTGDADSTFAKTGNGLLLLEADISAHTGTLAVSGGIMQLTAENVLGNAAAIVVNDSATLDLGGHNQSITTLDGAGTIAVGTADLRVTVAGGDATFAGSFTGEGKITKTGASKWTLSGASDHTGGFVYEGGILGLANSAALGAGTLTINTVNPVLSIEVPALNIPNNIETGAFNTTIETNGHLAEFSGDINGTGELTFAGTGTGVLSGRNTFANLNVNTPHLIMRSAASASNRVTIKTGSLLEFRDVRGGDVNGILSGDRVLFTSSTLTLRGANVLRDLEIAAGSTITVEGLNALGGSGSDVIIRGGSALRVIKPEVAARNMIIDGGAIVLANYYEMTALNLAGSLEFINNGEVRLGAVLPTGIYTAAIADGGIPNMPHYNPNQDGMFMVVDIIDGKKLQLTAYNMALEPGKDIVVGFDSILASMRTVYTHIGEEFLTPVINRAPGFASGAHWARFIGSFAAYGDDTDHLGYTDNTCAILAGYDWITKSNYMLGVYGGFNNTNLETTNRATSDIHIVNFGLYAAKRIGDLYASADLLAGFGNSKTVRREDHGNIVEGGYDINTFGAGLTIGYMIESFTNGTLRPNIGLRYMNLNLRDYNETGLGAVRLDGMRAYSLEATFMCDFTRNLKTPWGHPGKLDVRLGWRQNLQTDQSEIWATMVDYPAARMRIRGDKYDGSGITCGLGLRMMLTRKTSAGIAYDFDYIPMGIHDNDTIRHTFNALVRFNW